MVSPAIWNRAVILTKRKIERSIPLTVNEIQADKDQLRAEFAMSTRRLEMSVDELKEKARSQLTEISRKRDELAKYDEDKLERIEQLRELESKSNELTRRLEEREILLEETSRQHDKVQEQYVNTLEELSETRNKLADKEDEIANQRIEIAARDTKLDALQDMEVEGSSQVKRIANLKEQLADAKAEIERERLRADHMQEQERKAREETRSAVERLEKRNSELDTSRDSNKQDTNNITELNRQLIDAGEKNFELEAKLATQALKMEALIERASEHNVEAAAGFVKQQVADTQKQLEEVTRERDELKETLNGVSNEVGKNWADERRENAMLRERMNDMAAKIAVMTAEIEGDSSPIKEILEKEAIKSNAKISTDNKGTENGASSLAERIRAIQQAVSSSR